uniref:Uncharacterized protein n=1 Tax=Timema tahoe TaxID=61484 RepID=A0A7R9NY97_9NEOP|nr:unnamed protein product [Timema tahoe]
MLSSTAEDREIELRISVSAQNEVSSRISIADADPAGQDLPRHRRSTVTNDSDTVSFTPEDIRPRRRKRDPTRKDEL